MTSDSGSDRTRRGRIENGDGGPGASSGRSDAGIIGQAFLAVAFVYPVPPRAATALLVAGGLLGALGDWLLRAPDAPGLNLSLWIAAVAAAALLLQRRAGFALDRGRAVWLAIGVVLGATFAWRDAPPLRLLALASATLAFALAAHRLAASWLTRAGVVRYAAAFALGALHAWTATPIAWADAARFRSRTSGGAGGGRRVAAVARGLAIATPLVLVFGALFMSADAVFASLIANVFRFDFSRISGHVLVFAILAWLSTGYLRGFLTGTELPGLRAHSPGDALPFALKRPALGITEIATALGAMDLLFLFFVIVQSRYLFGGDALVQVTPNLTYADYARHGFFELVVAVALVVPILLAADWLLDRRGRRDTAIFRGLAGVQVVLVLAIAASALQRLRLYHASYGFTEPRFYAMVLLIWMGVMLIWLAATVLASRRHAFAFGALTSGLATIALLFVINPDAIIARTNVTRMASTAAPIRFDVAYATSLSADAVPVLIGALRDLPSDAQCRLARHMLRNWPPDNVRPIRVWNWSVARASDIVRTHEAELRSMVGPNQACAPGPA